MAKRFECMDENFIIQSNDEKEVMDAAMNHMKKHHKDMKMTHKDINDKMMDA